MTITGHVKNETEFDNFKEQYYSGGALTLIIDPDSGKQYKVFALRNITELDGQRTYPLTDIIFNAVFHMQTPYKESVDEISRTKGITANNETWTAEDMPSDNLLDNWSFETWSNGAAAAPDGWSTSFTNNTASRETDPIFGTYCAEFVNTGAGADDRLCRYYPIPLVAGTVYTFGAWIKSISGYTVLFLLINDASKGNNTITASWVFYTWTWTASTTGLKYLDLGDVAGGAATIRIDGAILVEGSSIPYSTFTKSIATLGNVDAVPDIQITASVLPTLLISQTEKL